MGRMEEKRLYALARYDQPSQRKIDICRNALVARGFVGAQTRGIPHHVTLASLPPEKEGWLRDRLERASREEGPIDLRLNAMGLFGLRVLFLAPAPEARLAALARALVDDPEWSAHTTMLIDERERVLEAIPLLADAFAPFAARVDAIDLYEFFPARHIAEYRLAPR